MSDIIKVKVATAKLISLLAAKLVVVKEELVREEADSNKQMTEAKFGAIAVALLKKGKCTDITGSTNYRRGRYSVEFSYDGDALKDAERFVSDYRQSDVKNIEQALRLLRLTDDVTVSTSAYASVARYL